MITLEPSLNRAYRTEQFGTNYTQGREHVKPVSNSSSYGDQRSNQSAATVHTPVNTGYTCRLQAVYAPPGKHRFGLLQHLTWNYLILHS
ncbi:MAG: hypothetical protein A3I78_05575 [Gammaproteobacteria bacterium RIFCSPLOWO2_02_FULL_56_15]|nr:MAG: hypothetical protein A3I78_05575 [Gammaproteobacteria bacterium RIFCSPLOWO2_02_FULL_56_15]